MKTYYVTFEQQGYQDLVVKVIANNPGEARIKGMEVFCMSHDINVSENAPLNTENLVDESGEEI